MSMSIFHLTYDATSSKYPNAMEDIIQVLCNKCNVIEIGHPVESTFVFKMTSSDYDYAEVAAALSTRFPKDFWFVISRVAYVQMRDTDSNIRHIISKPCKEHTDAFPAVLRQLKEARKISADVKNLSSYQ